MQNKQKIKYNGGAAMIILVFFFVFISLTILIGIVTPVVREFKIASDNLKSKQAYFFAESGVEDVIYRLKNSLDVDASEIIVLGDSHVNTIITDVGPSQKQISTIGDVNSHQRNIDVILNTATGVSFNYGLLAGQGGIYLDSGVIVGNVYANGPITASSSGSNSISGTAISANSPSIISDQSNGSGAPTHNIIFGNTDATQDIAQSFQTDTESPLNKVSLYIKKVGSPGNLTVKIMNDISGNVGTTLLASGSLPASSVTTSYGWIDVSFTTNPLLDTSKTYWLVLDGSSSTSKYYTIGSNINTYTDGITKIGKSGVTWYNTTPSDLDFFFNFYLGGVNGLIQGNGRWTPLHIGTVSGTAWAHTVNYISATGNIYCQSALYNNKVCISQVDPVYISLPVSDANISEWETDASSGGTYTGNYVVGYSGSTMGPKMITGNLTVSSGGTLTMTGTIWVKGNLVLNGGGNILLSSAYGADDAVIIVDGTITISGGGHATGSGTVGSYIMTLSKSTSTTAISVSGGAGAMIAYAPYGTIIVSGGASLKEATGYRIVVTGGSDITYESGLTNNNFSSGPSGTWGVNNWKEVE
jgi:hypothetical protein